MPGGGAHACTQCPWVFGVRKSLNTFSLGFNFVERKRYILYIHIIMIIITCNGFKKVSGIQLKSNSLSCHTRVLVLVQLSRDQLFC